MIIEMLTLFTVTEYLARLQQGVLNIMYITQTLCSSTVVGRRDLLWQVSKRLCVERGDCGLSNRGGVERGR